MSDTHCNVTHIVRQNVAVTISFESYSVYIYTTTRDSNGRPYARDTDKILIWEECTCVPMKNVRLFRMHVRLRVCVCSWCECVYIITAHLTSACESIGVCVCVCERGSSRARLCVCACGARSFTNC